MPVPGRGPVLLRPRPHPAPAGAHRLCAPAAGDRRPDAADGLRVLRLGIATAAAFPGNRAGGVEAGGGAIDPSWRGPFVEPARGQAVGRGDAASPTEPRPGAAP